MLSAAVAAISVAAPPGAHAASSDSSAPTGRLSHKEVREIVADIAPVFSADSKVLPDDSEVLRATGPRSLRLRGANGQHAGSLVSTMPIAVADPGAKGRMPKWRVADLGWRAGNDRFDVRRALGKISVPQNASGAFRVGALEARLAERAQTSTGAVDGETVTYANVLPDMDLVIRSLPIGFQAGWVLRGPKTPEEIDIPLTLPSGTGLHEEPDGGFEVKGATGASVARISATSATDADGNAVDVETKATQAGLRIRIDHKNAGIRYPIAVDPTFTYNWDAGSTKEDGWTFKKSRPDLGFYPYIPPLFGTCSGGCQQGPQKLVADGSGYHNAGDYGMWTRPAPGNPASGSTSAEHAFWYRADVFNINKSQVQATPDKPALGRFGFLNSSDQVQPSQKWSLSETGGSAGPAYFGTSTTGDTRYLWTGAHLNDKTTNGLASNRFSLGLFSEGVHGLPYNASGPLYNVKSLISAGYINLYAADNVSPEVVMPSEAGAWRKGSDPLTVTAKDNGTGIESVALRGSSGTVHAQVNSSCPAAGNTLCPFTAAVPLSLATVPEGRGSYVVAATDAGGRTTTSSQQLAVDRTNPSVTLEGALYTERASPIGPGEGRSLVVLSADDGPSGSAAGTGSGIDKVEVSVDDEVVSTTTQRAAGDGKALQASWELTADETEGGEHEIRVVATDRAGNEQTAQFTVRKDATADLAVPIPSLSGDLAPAANKFVGGGETADVIFVGLDQASGPDEGSGLARLGLEIDGTEVLHRAVDCNDPEDPGYCPYRVEVPAAVNYRSYREGLHTVQVTAEDGAGNQGRSGAWSVSIDRTPPTLATELHAGMKARRGRSAWVSWTGTQDPPLAGSADQGSGTRAWTYRWHDDYANTEWSEWATTSQPRFEADEVGNGVEIEVELRSADAVGNKSGTAELSTIIDSYGEARQGAAARSGVELCHEVDIGGGQERLPTSVTVGVEPQVGIEAKGKIVCGSTELNGYFEYRYEVCVDIKTGVGQQDYLKINCEYTYVSGSAATQLTVTVPCEAGVTQKYRTHTRITAMDTGEVVEGFGQADADLPCNEAGAWRQFALSSAPYKTSPSSALGANMADGFTNDSRSHYFINKVTVHDQDKQQLPSVGTPTGNHGWEAHHVVPAGERSQQFALAQAYAYACWVEPNGAINGVWLRGPKLKSTKRAYKEKLTPELRRRAYHPHLRRASYAEWISSDLRRFVDDSGKCLDDGSAIWGELRSIRGALRAGREK